MTKLHRLQEALKEVVEDQELYSSLSSDTQDALEDLDYIVPLELALLHNKKPLSP